MHGEGRREIDLYLGHKVEKFLWSRNRSVLNSSNACAVIQFSMYFIDRDGTFVKSHGEGEYDDLKKYIFVWCSF